MASEQAFQLEAGYIFENKYRILSELGRGGFGMVYLAYQESMDRNVALKVLNPGIGTRAPSARERFLREVKIISKLRHPNTVTIHDYGEGDDDMLYMVLEYVEGETLKDILKREGAQDPLRALALIRQICKSLAEAHSHGIVHRDLKPANIMVTNLQAEKDFVKVLDFGVARLLGHEESELTREGVPEGERALIGTPRYMSPEQVRSENLTGASDLYSLGLIMYELFVGEPAVQGDTTMGLITQQISPEPLGLASLSGLPSPIQKIVRKATQKSIGTRYRTAEQFVIDLEHAEKALSIDMSHRSISGSGNAPSDGFMNDFHHSQPDFRLLNDSYIRQHQMPNVSLRHTADPSQSYVPPSPLDNQDTSPHHNTLSKQRSLEKAKLEQAAPLHPPGADDPVPTIDSGARRAQKRASSSSQSKPAVHASDAPVPLTGPNDMHGVDPSEGVQDSPDESLRVDDRVIKETQKKRRKSRKRRLAAVALFTTLADNLLQVSIAGAFAVISFTVFLVITIAALAVYFSFSLQLTFSVLAALTILIFTSWTELDNESNLASILAKSSVLALVISLLLIMTLPNAITDNLRDEPNWMSWAQQEDAVEAQEYHGLMELYHVSTDLLADGIQRFTTLIGTYDDSPPMTYIPLPERTRPPEPEPTPPKKPQTIKDTNSEGEYVEW